MWQPPFLPIHKHNGSVIIHFPSVSKTTGEPRRQLLEEKLTSSPGK